MRLWALVQGTFALLFTISVMPMMLAGELAQVLSLIPGLVLLLIALVLWFAASSLARLIAKGVQQHDLKIVIAPDQLLIIGVALLGLFFVIDSAPREIWAGLEWVIADRQFDPAMPYREAEWRGSVGGIIEAIIGLLLLLGAVRLGPLVRYLRRAGTDADR